MDASVDHTSITSKRATTSLAASVDQSDVRYRTPMPCRPGPLQREVQVSRWLGDRITKLSAKTFWHFFRQMTITFGLEFPPTTRKRGRKFLELVGPEGPPHVAIAGVKINGWRWKSAPDHEVIRRPELPTFEKRLRESVG